MITFVDSSALYAVLDRDDRHHQAASRRWSSLLSGSARLLTSNYVVVESAALIQSRLGMAGLSAFVDDVQPVVEIEWVTPEEHNAGLHAALAAGRRRLSLVDCTSFQIMRRLGISKAFAFDRHFQEQGFDLQA